MVRTIQDLYSDYDSFCTQTLGKLNLYLRYQSYGSQLMIERSFELLFMKFEAFIEELFYSYALGNSPITGTTPARTVTLSSESDIEHLFSGGKEYPDWTRWDFVASQSSLFFSPSPFQVLYSHMSILNELKTIRNALSHISGAAQKKYQTLVRNRLGYFPATGMDVSSFLSTRTGSGSTTVYFQMYLDETKVLSIELCNPK